MGCRCQCARGAVIYAEKEDERQWQRGVVCARGYDGAINRDSFGAFAVDWRTRSICSQDAAELLRSNADIKRAVRQRLRARRFADAGEGSKKIDLLLR
jgi:hypothetical protein